jgi:hypothetical protein
MGLCCAPVPINRQGHHAMIRGALLRSILLALNLVTSGAAVAQAAPDGAVAAQVSEEITRQLGRGDMDVALRSIGGAMKSEATAQLLRGSLQAIKGFGRNQYADRVYARDYGRTNKDIIDKLNFDNSTVYVRYLFSVENGEWRLINFAFKTETSLPFPKEWTHIYP